jgi:hypothetical protein
MQPADPITPIFEVYVEERKVATLHEPQRVEMFWCSYRVEPTSTEADEVLHNEAIWAEVKFTVKAADGSTPNSHTFTGGDYVSFCRRETNRLSFRSLWPSAPSKPEHNPRAPLDAGPGILSRIRRLLARRESARRYT